jgi:hypothetical protein
MKTDQTGRNPGKWAIFFLSAVVAVFLSWFLFGETGSLKGQSAGTPATPVSSPIFTPAHTSPAEAVRHFFGLRKEPVQPIAYTHAVHIQKAELQCDFCHSSVATGPRATIPGVKDCMNCHQSIATDLPVIKQVAAYLERGEEIPWQRVYGWNEEAHVRFNHAPHIRAEVSCATCHGDVAQMTVAKRVVDHSMGFCVQCHTQKNASNDCLTCHY